MPILVSKFLNTAQHFSIVKFVNSINTGARSLDQSNDFCSLFQNELNFPTTETDVQNRLPYDTTLIEVQADVIQNSGDQPRTLRLRRNGANVAGTDIVLTGNGLTGLVGVVGLNVPMSKGDNVNWNNPAGVIFGAGDITIRALKAIFKVPII